MNRKTSLIVAVAIFLSLLVIGLFMNYQATRKKGKDAIFDFSRTPSIKN